jgi:hypothetical protein
VNPLQGKDRDLTDTEIEAIVREAITAEASTAHREAAPPSSAIVWWRAQMRARQEATKAVERPLTIVHAVAIACGLGLLLSAVGLAAAGLKDSAAWAAGVYQAVSAGAGPLAAIDLTSRWITLPMTAILVSVLVTSIAAYLIFADE